LEGVKCIRAFLETFHLDRHSTALQSIHDQFMGYEITSDEHAAQCRAIQEAAEVLAEFGEFDQEALDKVGLSGPKPPPLRESEYVTICDDLAIQLDSMKGLVANRARIIRDQRDAQHQLSQNMPAIPQHIAGTANSSSGARVERAILIAGRNAIGRGEATAAQVIARYGLTHPEDIADIQYEAALEAARIGGPRVERSTLVMGRNAILGGATVAQVIERYGLTHPEDIAVIQQEAIEDAATAERIIRNFAV
jgi:hypothetical protein